MQTCLATPEAGGFLVPSSDSAVGIVSGVTKDRWEFVQSTQQSFQIIPLNYPDKCLAADANGNLMLVTADTDNQNQLWYIYVNNGKYSITNVLYDADLYGATNIDNSIGFGADRQNIYSNQEKQWELLEYVCAIKNTDLNRYIKNSDGKNYNQETKITVGSSIDYQYDKSGFRIVYNETEGAYKLMPISSSNGRYRAMTATSKSVNATFQLYDSSVSSERQYFDLERQSDGSYVIALAANNGLVLTCSTSNVILAERTEDLTNQKWALSLYKYKSGSTDDYCRVEAYYRTYGFESPFGTNAERSMLITSDYGLRYLNKNNTNDNHKGLDLRTKLETNPNDTNRALYSPYKGTVIKIDQDSESGLYVVIDTGIPAYNNANYTVCVVYMHMKENSVLVSVNQKVSTETKLGQSGSTGTSQPHLHYGVFLHALTSTSVSCSTNTVNPSLFFSSDEYEINK